MRTYRTVTPHEAAQFSEAFDATKIKENKDKLCSVNVDVRTAPNLCIICMPSAVSLFLGFKDKPYKDVSLLTLYPLN